MSVATFNSDRLRQMAILVSIVDTAAAHELLSRLPAETSQKVLAALADLGEVSQEEKAQVLQLVQSDQFGLGPSQPATDSGPGSDTNSVDASFEDDEDLAADPNSIWAQLDRQSIVDFLRYERPAVIAVVLSQLSAAVAVQVLQELGPSTSGDAMRCLARMQDVDTETREALDNYIKERLGEAQLDVLPVPKYSKRVEAMLSMASTELRESWQQAIREQRTVRVIDDDRTSAEPLATPRESQIPAPRSDTELRPIPGTIVQFEKPPSVDVRSAPNPNTNVDAYQDILAKRQLTRSTSQSQVTPIDSAMQPAEALAASVEQRGQDIGMFSTTTSDQTVFANKGPSQNQQPRTEIDASTSQPARPEEVVSIPFSRPSERHVVDRTFLQLEFEKVLTLSPPMLAQLLSSVSPETVLLALAGASPKWMKRFYKMLDRRDAKMLDQKLRAIGALKMADIDVAQSELVDRAHELRTQSGAGHNATRAAA